MVSSVSSQTMPQSNITVICSKFGNILKGFFACLLIINHDIPAAAEQGIYKIRNSVSERKNFTPKWSHVFFKKLELVTHTTKLNAGNPTDSLESESIKVL